MTNPPYTRFDNSSGMARPQPTVPSRFGLAIKPVYASMAPDRSMVVGHRLVRTLRLLVGGIEDRPAEELVAHVGG